MPSEECSSHSKNFQEFQSLLLEKYQISVIEERGRYRYLHPDRDKRITEKALGTQYGKEHLEQLFLRKNPITILYVRSHLRLVVDLQKNVKAMQSPGYAHRVKYPIFRKWLIPLSMCKNMDTIPKLN